MQFRWMKLVLAIICLSVGASGADSSIGSWKLNLAKSKFDPGPPPKSVTVTFAESGAGAKVSTEGVDAQGKPITGGYTTNYDGKDIKLTGTGGPLGAEMIAVKRIDATTTEATYKRGGKVVGTAKRVVASDGKSMTITTTGTNAQGQKVKNVAVLDKQ